MLHRGPRENEFSGSQLLFNSALVDRNGTPARERRIDVLADRIALYVDSLVPQGRARCLDVGCGDMTLAEAVGKRKSRTAWRCIDVSGWPSELGDDAHRHECLRFDGYTIQHDDGDFDVALLCDVLHRAPADAPRLLAEAARVARHVLVKDHFERKPYSRVTLRLAHLIDDKGRDAEISPRYFTHESFVRLASEQKLRITALDCELDLDERLPFIAVLSRV